MYLIVHNVSYKNSSIYFFAENNKFTPRLLGREPRLKGTLFVFELKIVASKTNLTFTNLKKKKKGNSGSRACVCR